MPQYKPKYNISKKDATRIGKEPVMSLNELEQAYMKQHNIPSYQDYQYNKSVANSKENFVNELRAKGQTRLGNAVTDFGTGLATWATQLRPPTQQELEGNRYNASSGEGMRRAQFLAENTAWGLTDVMMPKVTSKIANRLGKKSKSIAQGVNESLDLSNLNPKTNKSAYKPATNKELKAIDDEIMQINFNEEHSTLFDAYPNIVMDPASGELIHVNDVPSMMFSERFSLSENKVASLKNKYKDEFYELYGEVPEMTIKNDTDLLLYARLKEAENLERISNHKKSNSFENTTETFLETNKLHNVYTPFQETLLDAYTRGYDQRMNLRDKSYGRYKFYKEYVTPEFEKLVLDNKLKQETIITRGTDDFIVKDVWDNTGKKIAPKLFSKLNKNERWSPDSFLSGSLDSEISFGNLNLKSEIHAPKGQSILFPNASGVSNFPSELEVVFPNKLVYEVTNKRKPIKSLTLDDLFDGPIKGKGEATIGKVDGGYQIKNKDGSITIGSKSAQTYLNDINRKAIEETPKFIHKIVNPYTVAGAALGTSQMNKKALGGQLGNQFKEGGRLNLTNREQFIYNLYNNK